MAKPTETKDTKDLKEEKENNSFQVFFYIVFIPLLFTIVLVFIALSFLGYDVKNTALTYGNKIPYLEKYIPEPEVHLGPDAEIDKLSNELKEKETKLKESTSSQKKAKVELEDKDKTITDLTKKIEELEKALEGKKLSDAERLKEIQKLATSYSSMEPASAAKILSEMDMYQASLIMSQMKETKVAKILEAMNPDEAAKLSIIMKELGLSENPEVLALQKQVINMMQSTDTGKSKISVSDMANTYSQIEPKQAATIFEKMSKSSSEFYLGAKILANMSPEDRSNILSKMDADTAKKYTKNLVR